MDLFSDVHGHQIVSTIIYALVGLVLFGLSYVIIEKVTPFSVRKEITEDQNVALGIIIGSMLIGLSIIIATAIA